MSHPNFRFRLENRPRSVRWILPALALGGLLGFVRPVLAEPAKPAAPPGAVRDRNAGVRVALIAGGASLFALSYAPLCAAVKHETCIPVAGPTLYGARWVREENNSSAEDGVIPPGFVFIGLTSFGALQLTGLAFVTLGVLMPRREERKPQPSLSVVPTLGPRAGRLSLVGSF